MRRNTSRTLFGGILLVLGMAIIAKNLLGIGINLFFPGWKSLFFIVPGIALLTNNEGRKKIGQTEKTLNFDGDESSGQCTAVFGTTNKQYPMQEFYEGKIDAVFGTAELDLRDAVITGDCIMEVSAIFGSANIRVPQGVRVRTSGIPLFGGVANHTREPEAFEAPTIFINTLCMFGGIEIK